MELYKVSIEKEALESLSQMEVLFFIQAGAALNEINILNKLLVVSNKEVEGPVETRAQNSQTLFILSILSGKLWECWLFLQKAYFQSKLSKTYENLLSEEAKLHLTELKSYFGHKNLIKDVRDKLAFHYDTGEIGRQLNQILQDKIPEFYLSEDQGNNFFYISDMIRMKIILEYTGKSDAFDALNTVFDEILNASKLFMLFLHHCLVVAARNHESWNFEKIEIHDPPSITDVFLPYFIGRPKNSIKNMG